MYIDFFQNIEIGLLKAFLFVEVIMMKMLKNMETATRENLVGICFDLEQ